MFYHQQTTSPRSFLDKSTSILSAILSSPSLVTFGPDFDRPWKFGRYLYRKTVELRLFWQKAMSEELYMPGATTVGMVCKDGVLLASERRYSYGTFVMSKVAKKVFKITDNIGVACAGIIGDMQVLAREALAYMNLYQFERGRKGNVRTAAKMLANLLAGRRLFPYLAQTIIGGVDDSRPGLYVLDPIGSVLEDRFSAVGTGAEIAMGVLESDFRDGLTVEEAKPIVMRAIRSALARDIASGDGIDLLVITSHGIKEESLRFS